MNNPYTVEGQVHLILQEYTEARNDDMKLYLLVCTCFHQRFGIQSLGTLPFAVVMNCYKELELPHFESVLRARQKLQARHPELAPKEEVKKGREGCERMYRSYAKS